MFGLKRKNNSQDNQIPYEVYETLQESSYRRQRLLFKLVVVIIAVTILAITFFMIQKLTAQNDTASDTTTTEQKQTSEQPQGQTQGQGESTQLVDDTAPNPTVVQSPQQNTPLPSTSPAETLSPNTTQNNTTIRKPE